MTHPDLHHARLAALSQSLRDLLAESRRVVSPEPALELAMLQAEYALAIDEQAEPERVLEREQVCCARMPGGVFCTRVHGHRGEHQGAAARPVPASDFGPEAAKRRRY